jgi:hypothetical protein
MSDENIKNSVGMHYQNSINDNSIQDQINKIKEQMNSKKQFFEVQMEYDKDTNYLEYVNKNKIILLLIAITFVLTSCGDGFSETECLSSVKEVFPKAKIYVPAEGSIYKFIVMDSVNCDSVTCYVVTTGNFFNSNISSIERLTVK